MIPRIAGNTQPRHRLPTAGPDSVSTSRHTGGPAAPRGEHERRQDVPVCAPERHRDAAAPAHPAAAVGHPDGRAGRMRGRRERRGGRLGLVGDCCAGNPVHGSDSRHGGDSPTGGGTAAMAAYRTCLANNGVTLPTPGAGAAGGAPPQGARPTGAPPSGAPNGGGTGTGGGPGAGGGPGSGAGSGSTAAPPGVDADTWRTARAACASLAPTAPAAASGTAAAN